MKRLFLLVVFLLSVLSLGSAGRSPLGAEAKPLNIAWTGGSNLTSLPDRIAMERGFFEKKDSSRAIFSFKAPT
jgi:ABC-type nitrate/sulfonate/bicarbonate transport system substrate-binding protein